VLRRTDSWIFLRSALGMSILTVVEKETVVLLGGEVVDGEKKFVRPSEFNAWCGLGSVS
jgi:hypothetical protein